MANYASDEILNSVLKIARPLADCDCSDLDESSYKACKKTSPWQPGSIVWVDLHGFDEKPVRMLVYRVEIKWSDHCFGYVNHAVGFIEKKGGGWQRMFRHISRGKITRGYDKAEKLGLIEKVAS